MSLPIFERNSKGSPRSWSRKTLNSILFENSWRRLAAWAKDAQADHDHEKGAFQVDKEGLLHDLNRREPVKSSPTGRLPNSKIKFGRRSPCSNLWSMSKATATRHNENRWGILLRMMLLKGSSWFHAYDFCCTASPCCPRDDSWVFPEFSH